MRPSVHLKKFSADELILTESETRTILQFFWPDEPTASRIEESLIINDRVRGFAQGLLVEAIVRAMASDLLSKYSEPQQIRPEER